MNVPLSFRPRLWDSLRGYDRTAFQSDFQAGLTVMTLAFPLSIAFAIAAGVRPEAGLLTAIIGGALISAFGGSKVQIGGPTGAFVIITFSVLASHGMSGLLLCTMLAGLMLLLLGLARLGSIIRFIPYPVSRAFTKGIAVLILSTQIKYFFGLSGVDMPASFLGKLQTFTHNLSGIHWPSVGFATLFILVIAWWPARLTRLLPGPMAGLLLGTLSCWLFGLHDQWGLATIASEFGNVQGGLPPLHMPTVELATFGELFQPAFTIAMLIAMQALLSAVVTDGLIDDRHDSNQELVAQGIANMVGPLFGCIPATGAVARSVVNARTGARSPIAGLIHCALILIVLVAAAPLINHVPLAVLSAILVVAAYRMVSWKQFFRLRNWPLADAIVFGCTFLLTVFANLTLAVEVGVILACLLMVKRIAETSQITAVDESTETEGSQHSLVGKQIPQGVLIFRVFGAFFFGVVDKLDDELKRVKHEPNVLILRMRKVLAIDATGLRALEDLHTKLRAKGKHLLLSAPHTQPLAVMINSGFIDRIGPENVCSDVTAALARAREILGLPPVEENDNTLNALQDERAKVAEARKDLTEAMERTSRALKTLEKPTVTTKGRHP